MCTNKHSTSHFYIIAGHWKQKFLGNILQRIRNPQWNFNALSNYHIFYNYFNPVILVHRMCYIISTVFVYQSINVSVTHVTVLYLMLNIWPEVEPNVDLNLVSFTLKI
jgi:hypothetical protein